MRAQNRKLGPVVLQYFPTVSPPLRRILEKRGFNVFAKSGVPLKNLLCGRNRDKPPDKRSVYKLRCPCNPNPQNAYIGYTIRRIDQRMKEHAGYIRRREDLSGIAQHLNGGCNGPVNLEHPEILTKV